MAVLDTFGSGTVSDGGYCQRQLAWVRGFVRFGAIRPRRFESLRVSQCLRIESHSMFFGLKNRGEFEVSRGMQEPIVPTGYLWWLSC
jgi:hypothetical protein